ncbi:MAG: DUF3300 domain-containing protein [Burkholderiales bacterium]|nr:DUF3300 domain-containing protein [Burkholderiales bacterium]
MKNRKLIDALGTTLLVLPVVISLVHAPVAPAQTYAPPPHENAQAHAVFSQQDLDQMLAPIALYPDPLLSQILMAATYPLEVVQAARWSRANPGLQGDQAVRSVEQKPWDPSVKSLVAFPQILTMMDERLEWTERLGDAFLAQESQVMDSVQHLRQTAYAAGTLRSDDQIRVVSQGPAIVVVPVNPQVIYVPYYDPKVVYGNWWWPEPPVYWAPWRSYHPPRPGFTLAWGSGIPVASGFFFGAFDWPRRQTRIVSVNTYYYTRTVVINRPADVHSNAVVRHANTAPGIWQHNPEHRRGAPYRHADVHTRFIPENAQMKQRAVQPAIPPQARTIEHGRNTPRDSQTYVAGQATIAAPRAGIQQETRSEIRSDDRRRQEVTPRNENRNEGARRREAPPAVRSERPKTQPRVEQHASRPAPVPQFRKESAVRTAPAAPEPQPRNEASRVRTPEPATTAHPAANARQNRPASGPGPRHGDGSEPRSRGRVNGKVDLVAR